MGPLLALAIGAALLASAEPEARPMLATGKEMKSVFCTLNEGGSIQTVQLRVPKTGSGMCEVKGISPTIISGGSSVALPKAAAIDASPYPPPDVPKQYGERSPVRVAMAPAPTPTSDYGLGTKPLDTLHLTSGVDLPNCRLVTRTTDGVIVSSQGALFKAAYTDLVAADRARVEPK